jgi:hypothetical protein
VKNGEIFRISALLCLPIILLPWLSVSNREVTITVWKDGRTGWMALYRNEEICEDKLSLKS